MDGRYRRSGRLVVAAGVTSTLVGFALLSDGFGAFRSDLRPRTLSGAGEAAIRAWHDAHTAALESRRWEGMLEVGEAALAAADGFDALSNRTAVSQSLRVADRVSAQRGDAGGRERVRRWVSQVDEPIVSTTDP